ncbi:MAG: Rieske 2Fe-2S domain-containing protein [Deltaproteobacteria bacterium]|nr:Rieske 2Fe-2S domain-containing protein [Deltaproteobacteria bacterium]
MAGYVKVAKADDVAPGKAIMVEVGGKKIALFNIGGSFYAIDDACSHRGGPLSEGYVEETQVRCPWHGALFDITNGAAAGPPAAAGVTKYNVRVEDSDVEVEV